MGMNKEDIKKQRGFRDTVKTFKGFHEGLKKKVRNGQKTMKEQHREGMRQDCKEGKKRRRKSCVILRASS